MRTVVQRVKSALVKVDNKIEKIGEGLLIYVGVGEEDGMDDCIYMADKILNLRIFEDTSGKMNLSVLDIKGELMVVSQFTLYGDCRKGRRPNFTGAMEPGKAKELYEKFIDFIRASNLTVKTGVFGGMMEINSINYGPVTILLDSKKQF